MYVILDQDRARKDQDPIEYPKKLQCSITIFDNIFLACVNVQLLPNFFYK